MYLNMNHITHEQLKKLLNYDSETGVFTWRVLRPGPKAKVGAVAGSISNKGRRMIQLKGRLYTAARVAWFYVHGVWPEDQIDHVNGNRLDDRFINLREATNRDNCRNRGTRCDNTSGHKGVHWIKHCKKWQARVVVNEIRTSLGLFTNIEDAVAAYKEAAKASYGEFYRE